MRVYMLTYGGYIVLTPSGRCYLVDTGTYGRGRHVILPWLEREFGVEQIEGIFLTHFHENHAGGAQYLIRYFEGRVGAVYSSGVYSSGQGGGRPQDVPAQDKLDEVIARYDIPHHHMRAGQTVADPELNIDILWPTENDIPSTKDSKGRTITDQPNYEGPMLLRMSYGDFSVLFLADQSPANLTNKVYPEAGDVQSTIIQMPHHGDGGFATPGVVDPVAPVAAFLETGPNWETAKAFLENRDIDVLSLAEGKQAVEGQTDGSYAVLDIPNLVKWPRATLPKQVFGIV